jgi:DNA-binding transcriptional ArsR family regulator
MTADVRMAEVAALVGDPARANILAALMGGRALTASELLCARRVCHRRRRAAISASSPMAA